MNLERLIELHRQATANAGLGASRQDSNAYQDLAEFYAGKIAELQRHPRNLKYPGRDH